jgi:phage terminase large subunit-like protein
MKLQTEMQNFCKTKSNQCKYVQLAIDRYQSDLQRTDIKMDWSKARLVILFVESLNHGDGNPFILEPWQKFILVNMFGWYYKNNSRRFLTVYIEVPRKNGKTELAAAICLIAMVIDTRLDAQIYTAATTRDQASICYNSTKAIVKETPWLKEYLKVKQYEIYNIEHGYETGKMKALSADSNTLDGLKPYIAVVDERHAHKTDEVYDVLKTGMGATKDPILFSITTAGFLKNGPCYKERKYCIDVLTQKLHDDRIFTIIYTLDDGDAWDNPKNFFKANPNLNVSVNLDYLVSELAAAKNDGTKEINFKTKYLNIWTDTVTTWISDDKWQATATNFTPESLYGRECFGGMDLSKSQDFSSFVLLFPPIQSETKFKRLYYFWIPEDVAKERHKRNFANYINWANDGFIEFTPGNVIDHQLIRRKLNELAQNYKIQFINYDAVFTTTLVTELMEDGMQLHPFRQGFISMAAPTSQYETMVLTQTLDHGFNPVMRWMISNVTILRDAAGNMKVDKSKPEQKVDGVVSDIMAEAAYMQHLKEKPPEKEYFFIKVK